MQRHYYVDATKIKFHQMFVITKRAALCVTGIFFADVQSIYESRQCIAAARITFIILLRRSASSHLTPNLDFLASRGAPYYTSTMKLKSPPVYPHTNSNCSNSMVAVWRDHLVFRAGCLGIGGSLGYGLQIRCITGPLTIGPRSRFNTARRMTGMFNLRGQSTRVWERRGTTVISLHNQNINSTLCPSFPFPWFYNPLPTTLPPNKGPLYPQTYTPA